VAETATANSEMSTVPTVFRVSIPLFVKALLNHNVDISSKEKGPVLVLFVVFLK
jgi:hypothetical protein